MREAPPTGSAPPKASTASDPPRGALASGAREGSTPPKNSPASTGPATDPIAHRLAAEGTRHFEAGRYEDALQAFRDAERGVPPERSDDRAELKLRQGRALAALGRLDAAAAALHESVQLRRSLVSPGPLAEALHALADAVAAGESPQDAQPIYEEALAQRRAAGSAAGEGRTLINLALLQVQTGHWGQASARLDEAAAKARSAPGWRDPDRIAFQQAAGVVRALLGQFDAARQAFRDAARIGRAGGDGKAVAEALRNEAFLELEQDRPARARALFDASLEAAPRDDSLQRALGLNGAGYALVRMGRGAEAEPALREAVSLLRGSSARRVLAQALESLGSALEQQARHDEARRLLLESLAITRQLAARDDEREVLASLARLAQSQGRDDEAILHLKAAVQLSQQLRRGAATLDRDSRATLARRLSAPYRQLAILLVGQGRLLEAERVMLALKDAEFAEYLRGANDPAAAVTMDAAERAAWAEVGRLSAELAEAYAKLEAHRLGTQPMSPVQLQASGEREQQLMDALFAQLAGIDERLQAARRARVTPVLENGVLVAKAEALSAAAGGEPCAVLMFVPGEQRTTVVLATAVGARPLPLDAGLAALRPHIAALQAAIVQQKDHRPAASALHRLLVEPVQRELAKLPQPPAMWMLLLTDELRYVPFAALVDGEGRHLVETVRLSQWVSHGAEQLLAPPRPWVVNAFASTRDAQAWGLKPLPAARAEVQALVRSAGNPQGLLPGQGLVDDRFTREAWTGVFVRRGLTPPAFTVVHVASHFLAQPGDWNGSFLLLGSGEEFRVSDLRSMSQYSLAHLDLLTLSACTTEVNQQAAGHELEGFGALLLRFGAHAVLGTLWSVQDEGTAALMQRFYAERGEQRRMSKAAALQRAQLALLRGELRSTNPALDMRHPYYWAPFVLMGNWL